ncbi:hypothetical protein SLEP1_g35394 [Rubroshorea leprosula]|uniref:Uncharacterized protein n=1 Tax=Rubroshorea leprosula TaxID=152421 RepID=A0AAV5KNK8_9ROSI|nr:hypothetical protein SLEP1_g35394 [Rubroshorea leprosula]
MAPLCLSETGAAMEGLYASGQVCAVGISNFSSKKPWDLLKITKEPPAVNQACFPLRSPGSLVNDLNVSIYVGYKFNILAFMVPV